MSKLKCLHIAPHYGGGVGSTVSSIINCFSAELSIESTVVSLDRLVNRLYIDSLSASVLVYENLFKNFKCLTALVKSADVVLIHYWNHPLLAVLLSRYHFPPCKIVFWTHASGLYEPNIIPSYLYEVAARVIYSSTISLSLPESSNPSLKQKICIARSARDIAPFLDIARCRNKSYSDKRAIYIGTVSRQKMHDDSQLIFEKLVAKGVSIDIVGEPADLDLVQSLTDTNGVTFHGYKSDILPFLMQADCFVYPLNSRHYGTGELVLVEAMASGLPCICMNNPAERFIVDHGSNGFLANSVTEFIDYALNLLESPQLLSAFSVSAIGKANSCFSLESTAQSLASQLWDVKRENSFLFKGVACSSSLPDPILGAMIHHSFSGERVDKICLSLSPDMLSSLVSKAYAHVYCGGAFCAETIPAKASPAQYLRYFPDSHGVADVCRKLALANNNYLSAPRFPER